MFAVLFHHLPLNKLLDAKVDNILNLEDAVRFLPGVTVKDQLGAFYRFSVRGSNETVVAVDGFRDERSLLNKVHLKDMADELFENKVRRINFNFINFRNLFT